MRLPNAPLLEVVFEFRWKVEQTGDQFGYDPGFAVYSDAFKSIAEDAGFKTHEPVSSLGPTFPHTIAHRFRKGEAFPLVQIGHGIFACNMSTEYDWREFRAMIAQGMRDLLKAYPDTTVTPLVPTHLELRYVDVFNEEIIGSKSWFDFMAKCSNVLIGPIPYLDSVTTAGTDQVNFVLRHDLKDTETGRFELQIGNGSSSGKQGILMTSKVIRGKFEAEPARDKLEGFVMHWADAAHAVTSEFFKKFVCDSVMKQFKEVKA